MLTPRWVLIEPYQRKEKAWALLRRSPWAEIALVQSPRSRLRPLPPTQHLPPPQYHGQQLSHRLGATPWPSSLRRHQQSHRRRLLPPLAALPPATAGVSPAGCGIFRPPHRRVWPLGFHRWDFRLALLASILFPSFAEWWSFFFFFSVCIFLLIHTFCLFIDGSMQLNLFSMSRI